MSEEKCCRLELDEEEKDLVEKRDRVKLSVTYRVSARRQCSKLSFSKFHL